MLTWEKSKKKLPSMKCTLRYRKQFKPKKHINIDKKVKINSEAKKNFNKSKISFETIENKEKQ